MTKLDKIKKIIKDPHRKSLLRILIESIHAGLIEKEIPSFYFYNLLYKNENKDYRKFTGNKINNKLLTYYDKHENINLEDKKRFQKILNDAELPTPFAIAHTKNHMLFYKTNKYDLDSANRLKEVLNLILTDSTSESIFIKPNDGGQGKGVFSYNGNDTPEIQTMFSNLSDTNFIVQETLEQHESISRIYPNSINTLRVNSFYDKKTREVIILSAGLRVGARGSNIDNLSAGGVLVEVDITSNPWTLKGLGKRFFEHGGESFKAHPDSGIVFDGYQLPNTEKIRKLVKNVAPLFASEIVGWDIAITKNGLSVIEGNSRPHIYLSQIAVGGFKSNSTYEKFIKKL